MDINDFQDKVLKVASELEELPNRAKHTKQSALIHLVEEVGEVARHLTDEHHRPEKFDGNQVGSELADVLMFIVILADLYNVALPKEMEEAIERIKNKASDLSN